MLYRRLFLAVSMLAGMCFGTTLGAERVGRASWAPGTLLEQRLLEDAADGTLDHHSLLTAALIASGVSDDTQLIHWRKHLERQLERFEPSPGQRAMTVERLFELLHSQLLTGRYDSAATELPATLGRGDYNCLTATTLLVVLGERYAIPLEPISTSGHIFCRLKSDPARTVESTCRKWFELPAADRTVAMFPAAPGTARPIDRVQLLGKFYYNRGVALLADRQFARAVKLLEISRRLDAEDGDARENLLAGLNNWALALIDQERFEEAAELVREGQAIGPGYGPLLANDLHLHHRWLVKLCAERQYPAALRLMEEGHRRRPDAELFSAGLRAVQEEWIDWHLRRGEHQAAAEVARYQQRAPGN
jgi:tetratricopeptide (TPR) repeat protein